MRALTASDLLGAWERGAPLSPPRRALLLLALACPEQTPESLARLTLGRRDAILLRIRESAFGPGIDAAASCPKCSERLECSVATQDFLPADPTQTGLPVFASPQTLSVEAGGHAVTFRLPDTFDVIALAEESGADRADPERLLLRRCIVEARRKAGPPVAAGELPPDVVEAVANRMAEADPQADLELALTCPACGHAWPEPFDVGAYLWSEIDTWARRTLGEVHTLASAYGWSEADIVALSPTRRRHYLECVGA